MKDRTIEQLCEEYIDLLFSFDELSDCGIFGLYGLEQHRIKIHEEICELLNIDRDKSKEILSYLDEKIGLDFSERSENKIRYYAKKLLDLLKKEKGNLQ